MTSSKQVEGKAFWSVSVALIDTNKTGDTPKAEQSEKRPFLSLAYVSVSLPFLSKTSLHSQEKKKERKKEQKRGR